MLCAKTKNQTSQRIERETLPLAVLLFKLLCLSVALCFVTDHLISDSENVLYFRASIGNFLKEKFVLPILELANSYRLGGMGYYIEMGKMWIPIVPFVLFVRGPVTGFVAGVALFCYYLQRMKQYYYHGSFYDRIFSRKFSSSRPKARFMQFWTIFYGLYFPNLFALIATFLVFPPEIADAISACVWAPLFEEQIKFDRISAWAFGLLEFYLYVSVGSCGILYRIPALMFHVYSWGSGERRVVEHALFNGSLTLCYWFAVPFSWSLPVTVSVLGFFNYCSWKQDTSEHLSAKFYTEMLPDAVIFIEGNNRVRFLQALKYVFAKLPKDKVIPFFVAARDSCRELSPRSSDVSLFNSILEKLIEYDFETILDNIDNILDMFANVESCSQLYHVKRLITAAIACNFIDSRHKVNATWFGFIDKELMRDLEEGKMSVFDYMSICKSATSLIRSLVGIEKAVLRTPEDYINAVSWLITNRYNRAVEGATPCGTEVSHADYMEVVRKCAAFKMASIKRRSVFTNMFNSYHSRFMDIHREIVAENASMLHPVTMIAISGPVSLGKSAYLFKVFAAWAMKAHGVEVDLLKDDWMGVHNPDDQFMMSFISGKTSAYLFDEINNMHDELKNIDAEGYRNFQSLTDGTKHTINRPHLEAKGKEIFNPYVVGALSNHRDFRLSTIFKDVTPSLRRMDIKFDVKPRWAKENGELDVSKIDFNNPDAWETCLFEAEYRVGDQGQTAVVTEHGTDKPMQLTMREACELVYYVTRGKLQGSSTLKGCLKQAQENIQHIYSPSERVSQAMRALGKTDPVTLTVRKIRLYFQMNEYSIDGIDVSFIYHDVSRIVAAENQFSFLTSLSEMDFRDQETFRAALDRHKKEVDISKFGIQTDASYVSFATQGTGSEEETNSESAYDENEVLDYLDSRNFDLAMQDIREENALRERSTSLINIPYSFFESGLVYGENVFRLFQACCRWFVNDIQVRTAIRILEPFGLSHPIYLIQEGRNFDTMCEIRARWENMKFVRGSLEHFQHIRNLSNRHVQEVANNKAKYLLNAIKLAGMGYAGYRILTRFTRDTDSPEVKPAQAKWVGKAGEELLSKIITIPVDDEILGVEDVPSNNFSGNQWDDKAGLHDPSRWSGLPKENFLAKIHKNLAVVRVFSPGSKVDAEAHSYTNVLLHQDYAIGPWHLFRRLSLTGSRIEVLKQVYKPKIGEFDESYCESVIAAVSGHFRIARIGKDVAMVRIPGLPFAPSLCKALVQEVIFAGNYVAGKVTNPYWDLRDPSFDSVPIRLHVDDGTYYVSNEHYTIEQYRDLPSEFIECNSSQGLQMMGQDHTFNGRCGSPAITYLEGKIGISGIYVAGSGKRHYFEKLTWRAVQEGETQLSQADPLMNMASMEYFKAENNYAIRTLVPKMVPCASSRDVSYWLTANATGKSRYVGRWTEGRTFRSRSKVRELPLHRFVMECEELKEYHHTRVQPRFGFSEVEVEGQIRRVNNRWHSQAACGQRAYAVNLTHMEVILEFLAEKWVAHADFSEDFVQTATTTISGSSNNGYCNPAPRDTSDGGLPVTQKKHKHFVAAPTEYAPDGVKLTPEKEARVYALCLRLAEGQRIGMHGICCDKDEPTKKSKVDESRERVFQVADLEWYIIQSRFFGVFMGIFARHFLVTETMCGVNPFSEDWDRVAEKLSRFGYIFNGDYKNFDKTIPAVFIMFALNLITRIKTIVIERLKGDKVPQWMKNSLRAIITDMMNSIIVDGCDVWEILGTVLSGMLMTLIVNNIVNSFILRAAFLNVIDPHSTLSKEQLEQALHYFESNVAIQCQGDDNAVGISEEIKEAYNFQAVHHYCASIGMTYTPADKGDPAGYFYESTEGLEICKRHFVQHAERGGRWSCPLDKESIGKMLTIRLESSLDEEEAQHTNNRTALYELVQHGREEFNRVTSILKNMDNPYAKDFDYSYEEILALVNGTEFFPWKEEFSETSLLQGLSIGGEQTDLYGTILLFDHSNFVGRSK